MFGTLIAVCLIAGIYTFNIIAPGGNPMTSGKNTLSSRKPRDLKNNQDRLATKSERTLNLLAFLEIDPEVSRDDVIKAIIGKVHQTNNQSEFNELLDLISDDLFLDGGGGEISNAIWIRYPAENSGEKFSLLFDYCVSSAGKEDNRENFISSIMAILGLKFIDAGCPDLDIEKAHQSLTQKMWDAFGNGLDNYLPFLTPGEERHTKVSSFLTEVLSKEISSPKLTSLVAPYTKLYLNEHPMEESITHASTIFSAMPEFEEQAFSTLLKDSNPSPKNVGRMINEIDLANEEISSDFLKKAVESVSSNSRNSPEEIITFLSGLHDPADQISSATIIGRSLSKRMGDGVLKLDFGKISPEVKAVIIESYSGTRQR